MVVIPNVLGLCVYSPPLDFRGNSVRGIEFCKLLNQRFNFHVFTQFIGNAKSLSSNDPLLKVQSLPVLKRNTAKEQNSALVIECIQAAASGHLIELQQLIQFNNLNPDQGDYDMRSKLF